MSKTRPWIDPFDDMSDEELDAHVDTLFAKRPRTVGVSLRVPAELLERVRRQAARTGTPYQTFMKGMLEAAVDRLERSRSSSRAHRGGRGRARAARSTGRRSGTAA